MEKTKQQATGNTGKVCPEFNNIRVEEHDLNKPLTELGDLQYLLSIAQGEGKKMIGKIRTKQKCPICQKPFTHVPKLGFLCSAHKTTPKRFFVDLYWKKQIRIYSDKQGQPLDSYHRALILQGKITHEVENHIFDPSKYMRSEMEKFYVSNLLDKFEERKLLSLAPSYQKDYRLMVRRAKDFFGLKDIRELQKMDLIEYKEHLERLNLSPKTVKNVMDHFKTFLRYCKEDLEIIDSYPSFPKVEITEKSIRWVGREDQIKLLEHIPEEDRPIIAFLALHGQRPAEARALRVKDVDLGKGTIIISSSFSGRILRDKRKGRGAKPVEVPIHPELYAFIASRVNQSLPGAFLFTNPKNGQPYSANKLRRIWENVRRKVGAFRELRLYDATRHSFASQLREAGVPIESIKDHLGHADIRTTLKYAHGKLGTMRANLEKLSLQKVVTIPRLAPEEIYIEKDK
jgi:integrase